jgi:uncharacterized membrane protein
MAFCGRCGAPAGAPQAAVSPQASSTGLTPNVAAALSYLLGFISGIVFLAIDPHRNDKFVRFHAFQSIFFSLVVMVFWILYSNLFLFGFGFLWGIWSLVGSLVSLAVLAYWLFLMYKAYNNERYMIPFLGDFAARQAH